MIKMILKVISNNLINLIINLIKYFDIELTISVLQSNPNKLKKIYENLYKIYEIYKTTRL